MKGFVLFCFMVCAPVLSFADEIDAELQNIVDKITKKDWSGSMSQLLDCSNDNAEVNLVWAIWYGGVDNPKYDLIKSTRYLEISSNLGSRDAQLMLVSRYLFSSDSKVANYSAGVKMGKDLAIFYEKALKEGRDDRAEINRILGKFYIFGIGVEKNIDHGVGLIKRAADLGDKEAKRMLGVSNK